LFQLSVYYVVNMCVFYVFIHFRK